MREEHRRRALKVPASRSRAAVRQSDAPIESAFARPAGVDGSTPIGALVAVEALVRKFDMGRKWWSKRQPLRCMVCSASSADGVTICVDHVIAVKADWSRRLDPTNFGLLCNDCNRARGSLDGDDYRPNVTQPEQTNGNTER
jgi:5-methylcytosine-specific restriction endonuclease McrA